MTECGFQDVRPREIACYAPPAAPIPMPLQVLESRVLRRSFVARVLRLEPVLNAAE
jgi:hypothetical protein